MDDGCSITLKSQIKSGTQSLGLKQAACCLGGRLQSGSAVVLRNGALMRFVPDEAAAEVGGGGDRFFQVATAINWQLASPLEPPTPSWRGRTLSPAGGRTKGRMNERRRENHETPPNHVIKASVWFSVLGRLHKNTPAVGSSVTPGCCSSPSRHPKAKLSLPALPAPPFPIFSALRSHHSFLILYHPPPTSLSHPHPLTPIPCHDTRRSQF